MQSLKALAALVCIQSSLSRFFSFVLFKNTEEQSKRTACSVGVLHRGQGCRGCVKGHQSQEVPVEVISRSVPKSPFPILEGKHGARTVRSPC